MRTLMPSRTRALHERLNEASLPHACTIETRERVDDGEGGKTGDWVPGITLPCRVSPIGTAEERVRGEQLVATSRHVVVFQRATVIPLAARLSVVIDDATILLDPHGSNGPRTFEAQRKYECSLWQGPA
jgi:hypothetical protein